MSRKSKIIKNAIILNLLKASSSKNKAEISLKNVFEYILRSQAKLKSLRPVSYKGVSSLCRCNLVKITFAQNLTWFFSSVQVHYSDAARAVVLSLQNPSKVAFTLSNLLFLGCVPISIGGRKMLFLGWRPMSPSCRWNSHV